MWQTHTQTDTTWWHRRGKKSSTVTILISILPRNTIHKCSLRHCALAGYSPIRLVCSMFTYSINISKLILKLFSTNLDSQLTQNDTTRSYTYNERLTESHIWFIKLYHNAWSLQGKYECAAQHGLWIKFKLAQYSHFFADIDNVCVKFQL